MAEARKFMQKTEKVVIEETPAVELILTDEEAKALMTVLGNVGGSPRGPRGYISDIAEKLLDLGYGYLIYPDVYTGNMSFKQDDRQKFIDHYDRHKY